MNYYHLEKASQTKNVRWATPGTPQKFGEVTSVVRVRVEEGVRVGVGVKDESWDWEQS